MDEKPIRKSHTAPLLEFDVDCSQLPPPEPRHRKAKRMVWPDEVEARWKKITLFTSLAVGVVAFGVGVLVGRFLLP